MVSLKQDFETLKDKCEDSIFLRRMKLQISSRTFILLLFIFQLLTIESIFFDYPILRVIFGFVYLSIIPGIVILLLLRIKDIKSYLLTIPLSIVFVSVIGLIINQFSMFIGITEPISFYPMVLFLVLLTAIMTTILYVKQEFYVITLQCEEFSNLDKLVVILSITAVALSVHSSVLLNGYNSNVLVYALFTLLCVLIIIAHIYRSKINSNLFPLIIYSIGLSLLLSWALKSDFIIMGADTDWEYYLYSETIENHAWRPYTAFTVDSCLSISLLPAIYQIFLNVDHVALYKILFALLFSVSPLIVYSISKKYLSGSYAFFATMIFISYYQFFTTNNRNNIGLLFCIAFIFVLFALNSKKSTNTFLLITLFLGSILSHYTTSLLFWIVLAIFWSVNYIIYSLESDLSGSTKFHDHNPYRSRSQLLLIPLLFSMLYFWYAITLEAPFHQLVAFLHSTSDRLYTFLGPDASTHGGNTLEYALGVHNAQSFAYFVEYFTSWSIVLFMCLGSLFALLLAIKNYSMIKKIPLRIPLIKYNLLSMDVPFITLSIIAVILVGVSFLFPYVSSGYDILRVYSQFLVVLCPFFVIGVILLSHIITTTIHTMLKYAPWLRSKLSGHIDTKASVERANIVILILVILYFSSTTGFNYQLNGINKSIIFNTDGDQYNDIIIKEGELVGASWLMDYSIGNKNIYTDLYGRFRVIMGGGFNPDYEYVKNRGLHSTINIKNSYIFMRHYNLVEHKILISPAERVDLMGIRSIVASNNIYNNGECKILLP